MRSKEYYARIIFLNASTINSTLGLSEDEINKMKDEAKAEKTIEWYRQEKDTECYYEEKDGKYLIYRTSDRKTLKSINYSPADLKGILED